MALKYVKSLKSGKAYMMANEAIVRYALESDVKVVAFYPGSPQTEILNTFEQVIDDFDIRMEIATNEKVALEVVAGASMIGLRSLTSMKSVGLNVASDTLYSLAYTGVIGGCVIIVADDPHAHSSQSEQDGRWFGYTAYVPMLEPSSPEEAGQMTKFAFDLSEKFKIPVLIRTTTRINHQSSIVHINELERTEFKKKSVKGLKQRFCSVGSIARELKVKLIEKIKDLKEFSNNSNLNRIEYFDGEKFSDKLDSSLGIITSGVSYSYTKESLKKLSIKAKILKIGVLNPLPDKIIAEFIKDLKTVVVVEELSPYIEREVFVIAKEVNPDIEIVGKKSGHFKEYFEYNVPIVVNVLSDITGKKLPLNYRDYFEEKMQIAKKIPTRPPIFCAGCPHRATFWALRRAVKIPRKIFFSNDIGCYSMMCFEGLDWTDSLLCMGASGGIGAGVQYSIEEKVIAVMGDSTFFHAGLPSIINAVHHNDDITFIILDNQVTAMTGQQSHPGNPFRAGRKPAEKINIEDVLKGLGIKKLDVIDTFADIKENIKVFSESIKYNGVSAVVVKGECALYHFRNYRREGGKIIPYYIDKNKCDKYYVCIFNFMCPAIVIDIEDGKPFINEDECVGCGVCAQLCPSNAILSTATLYGAQNKPYTTIEDYLELKEIIDNKGKL